MKKALTIAPNNTPAVASQAWPTQRQIRELAENLDDYVEYQDRLCAAAAYLRKMDAARIPEEDFANVKRTIERYSKCDYKERIKELNDKWKKINPRHWYAEDDDEQLNVAAVSRLLANFMGSFPTSNIPNPKVFTRQLLEDVIDLDPRFPEVESACRKLRKSQKFMPSIAEVVDAIGVEQGEWGKRSVVLNCLGGDEKVAIDLLATALKKREAARIEAAKREAEWREAEQKRLAEISAARTAPICVGDRVRCKPGRSIDLNCQHATVTGVVPREDGVNLYTMTFDRSGYFMDTGEYLERLAAREASRPLPDFRVGELVYHSEYGPCAVAAVKGWAVAVTCKSRSPLDAEDGLQVVSALELRRTCG